MLKMFADTLAGYKSGILACYEYRTSSGPLEGANNKIKTMKRMAYGFRGSDASMTRSGATRPLKLRLVAAPCTCLGGTDLVAFTPGRALADPECIEISERPNCLSYPFQ